MFKYYIPTVGAPYHEVKQYQTQLSFGPSGFFIDAAHKEIHLTCVQDNNAQMNFRATQVQVMYRNDFLAVSDILYDLFPLQAAPYISCR